MWLLVCLGWIVHCSRIWFMCTFTESKISHLYCPYRNTSVNPENQLPVKTHGKFQLTLKCICIYLQHIKRRSFSLQWNGILSETYQLIFDESVVLVNVLFRHAALWRERIMKGLQKKECEGVWIYVHEWVNLLCSKHTKGKACFYFHIWSKYSVQ